MKAANGSKRKRRDILVRMDKGDSVIVKSLKKRRRVRVQADEGVSVVHIKKS